MRKKYIPRMRKKYIPDKDMDIEEEYRLVKAGLGKERVRK